MQNRAAFALLLAGCGAAADAIPPSELRDDLSPSAGSTSVGSASPSTEIGQSPTAAPAPTSPTPTLGDFKLVFEQGTGDWTNQIVIAPWGDVIAIGGHRLRVLARDSGKELANTPICFTQSVDAAAFIDDKRLLIACSEQIDEVTFPEVTVRLASKLPARMEEGAIGGGRVVVGVDGFWNKGNNHVYVYDAATFKVVDEFDASGKIEAIAVSADGNSVAAGTDGAGIDVRDIKAKKTRTHLKGDDERHSAVRFSPDSKLLFTDTDSFLGGEIEVATGKIASSFKAGSWLRAMRYLSPDAVIATGSDGLVFYSGKGVVTRSPVDDLGEGLDLSKDKTFFCAAGRGGNVACFSTKPVPPSAFGGKVARPSDASSSGSTVSTPPPKAIEIEGKVLSRAANTLTLEVADATGLGVGKRAELLKRFEQNIGFKMTGFISVADVEVKSISGNKVVLTILKETSEIVSNGKKVDQLTAKSAMKLVLTP